MRISNFGYNGKRVSPRADLMYRGTSLIRNSPLLEPYSRTVPRALWWPQGVVLFLMSEVLLYPSPQNGTKPSLSSLLICTAGRELQCKSKGLEPPS